MRSHRLAARSEDSQSSNPGSIPGGTKRTYKYQYKLLEAYQILGTQWHKTGFLRNNLPLEEKYDLAFLQYLANKKLIFKARWKDAGIKNPTRSDQLSTWWKITIEGVGEIANVFGNHNVKEEDIRELAHHLLRRTS
jgi:hypothetical protein